MRYLLIIIVLIFSSCKNNYEAEESHVIHDITQYHLNLKTGSVFKPSMKNFPKAKLDSLHIKIFVSDTLSAMHSLSSMRKFVSDNNRYIGSDQTKLKQILAQENFKKLDSRTISLDTLTLERPFELISGTQLKSEDFYMSLHFSRVCFDKSMQNGLVTVNYGFYNKDYNPKNMRTDDFRLVLVKKINGKWKATEY